MRVRLLRAQQVVSGQRCRFQQRVALDVASVFPPVYIFIQIGQEFSTVKSAILLLFLVSLVGCGGTAASPGGGSNNSSPPTPSTNTGTPTPVREWTSTRLH